MAAPTAAGRCIPGPRIEDRSVQRWHYALSREFFCPVGVPIRTAAEGIDALKRGGHPNRGAVPARGY